MSERDLAQVAARRLREAHDGNRAGAGFTKARIVKTLHERRRRRRVAWVVVGPLFAVFVGSTAWAQVTGHWPVWIQQAVLLFTAEQVSLPAQTAAVDEPRPRSNQGRATGAVPEQSDEGADQREETLPLEETAAVQTTNAPVVVGLAARRSGEFDDIERSSGKQRARRTESLPSISGDEHAEPQQPIDAMPSPAPVSSAVPVSSAAAESADAMQSPPILEADPELRAFRAGHDQHYRANDAAAAIVAYRRYLERYPGGRFVPEARYNIALSSLRLGRNDDAKRILEAFAEGRYGTYRRAEAKALLDAMD